MLEIVVKRRSVFGKKELIGSNNLDLENFMLFKDSSGDEQNKISCNLFIND